jgi:hypothetical protein
MLVQRVGKFDVQVSKVPVISAFRSKRRDMLLRNAASVLFV